MRSRFLAGLAALALAAMASAGAEAQIRLDRPAGGGNQPQSAPAGGTVQAVTAQQLLGVLSNVGFAKGQVVDTKRADLQAFTAAINSQPVTVVLGGCEAAGCSNFVYVAYFGKQDVSADFINGYNRDKRWSRLYIDKDGDLTLAMDVPLFGGVTPGFLAATGALYINSMKELFGYKT